MNLNPTITPLNPFAPEYNPIPPGVAPHPHAPLPPFLSPPPPAVRAFAVPQQPFYPHYAVPRRSPPPAGERRWRKKSGFINRNPRFEKRPSNYCYYSSSSSCGGERKSMQRNNRHGKRGFEVMPLRRDEGKTTVMIKNIPYDCPREELTNVIDMFCLLKNAKAKNEGTSAAAEENQIFIAAYDFLYLPIDFRGFAFVNFTNAATVWKFFEAFHQKKIDFIQRTNKWTKKIEVVTAKIQGKEALVNHFSGSIFNCETDEFLPVTFDPARDGSGQPGKVTVIGSRRSRAISRFQPRCDRS